MANMTASARLVSRLRANKLLPSGGFIKLCKAPGPNPPEGWSWHAVNAITKQPLGVGSYHGIEVILRAKNLRTRADGEGRVSIEPEA